jgi:hypothetical protein
MLGRCFFHGADGLPLLPVADLGFGHRVAVPAVRPLERLEQPLRAGLGASGAIPAPAGAQIIQRKYRTEVKQGLQSSPPLSFVRCANDVVKTQFDTVTPSEKTPTGSLTF